MSSVNKLFKNSAIFAISNFASKFLVFLLLPFYTRVLTTSDFGSADLLISVVSLLIPIFTLSVSDGALRFAISKSTDNKHVFTYGVLVIALGFFFLLLLYPVFAKVLAFRENLIFLYLIFLTSSLNNYFNRFIKGLNKLYLIGIVGVLSTFILVSANILFLVILDLGIKGYLLSYFLMNLFSLFILFVSAKLYRYISWHSIDLDTIMDMNKFNIPLIPNRISWILISTFNKYSLAFFWGTSLVGIFSAANRLPSFITAFYGIVQQALLLVVIEEYEEKNKSEIFVKVYHGLSTLLLILVILINILIKPLATIIFSNNFYEAYKIAPILVISSYFGALHGNLTTIYSATKNTSILFQNSVIGMILTVVLSLILVPKYNLYGAIISLLIVYFIMWLRLYIITSKTIKFNYSIKQDIISYFLIILQWITLVSLSGLSYYFISIFIFIIIVLLKRKHITFLIKILILKFKELWVLIKIKYFSHRS